ncbi:MAG: RluA family pseudouridine synthase [Candidatus Pacebacteria bacterium]|nr:RluA family pseudouridine synthase [Candidatus Paceibacterota bacterium]
MASQDTPEVVYQDRHFLVLNKPAGLIVNRAKSVKGPTLQDWIEQNFSLEENRENLDFIKRSGLVHRLDKDTSGLILVARTAGDFKRLQALFKKRKIKKRYLALVHGQLPCRGRIEIPIGRNPYQRGRFRVTFSGKKALTDYETLRIYQKSKRNKELFSLLALFPSTGRTHQLRVHLKHLHRPIVADPFYVGRKTYREDQSWCPRLFLHASDLRFRHPETGRKVFFSINLPETLRKVLKELSVYEKVQLQNSNEG